DQCDRLLEDRLAGAELLENPRTRRLHWVTTGSDGKKTLGEELQSDSTYGARGVVVKHLKERGRGLSLAASQQWTAEATASTRTPFEAFDAFGAEVEGIQPPSWMWEPPAEEVLTFGADAELAVTKDEALDFIQTFPTIADGMTFRAVDIIQGVLERRKIAFTVDVTAAKRAREVDIDWPPENLNSQVAVKRKAVGKGSTPASAPAPDFGVRRTRSFGAFIRMPLALRRRL
ncbi:hypothetical protein HK405_009686, partial [Cladochytrium tenue]